MATTVHHHRVEDWRRAAVLVAALMAVVGLVVVAVIVGQEITEDSAAPSTAVVDTATAERTITGVIPGGDYAADPEWLAANGFAVTSAPATALGPNADLAPDFTRSAVTATVPSAFVYTGSTGGSRPPQPAATIDTTAPVATGVGLSASELEWVRTNGYVDGFVTSATAPVATGVGLSATELEWVRTNGYVDGFVTSATAQESDNGETIGLSPNHLAGR